MGKYVYQSHMGGLYTREDPVPWEYLYCDTCGDSDLELGFCDTRTEAKSLVEEMDLYEDEYIKEFLDENFPEEDNV